MNLNNLSKASLSFLAEIN